MGVVKQSCYTDFNNVQSMRHDQNAARDSDLSLPFLACLLLSLQWIKDCETRGKRQTSMERMYTVRAGVPLSSTAPFLIQAFADDSMKSEASMKNFSYIVSFLAVASWCGERTETVSFLGSGCKMSMCPLPKAGMYSMIPRNTDEHLRKKNNNNKKTLHLFHRLD